MIDCQRHLFDIPDDVAYLNCAYMSPLMTPVQEAAREGVAAKARPWTLSPPDFFSHPQSCRELFARLVNCDASAVAFIPAASYGLAVAARNVPVRPGQKIILLEDQFPSNVYAWRDCARRTGGRVRTVTWNEARRADGDGTEWTAALLDAIDDDTAVVAAAHCHWTDGSLIDLERIGAACRRVGAALVLDITQSGGAWPFDVRTVQPDFLVCACYKWLLGPYSLGFLYVDEKWHQGEPLEYNWISRRDSEDFAGLVDYRDDYQPGADRFDMGERANFHLMPMAAAALRQILDWGVDAIATTLTARTTAIAERAGRLGLASDPLHLRAGHFLGVRFPGGIRNDLLADLAARNIYVSVRGSAMRITPHLYNTEEDVDRLFAALENEI